MLASLRRNWQLVIQMTRREVVGRYQGSVFGLAWSFFNPVLMLFVYTFVFSVVFKARWHPDREEGMTDFAILLFVGMILHGLLAECVNRAPLLVLSQPNYVKKVVFPLESLAVVATLSALFHSFVSLAVLLIAQALFHQQLPWTVLLFPLVIAPLAIATTGITWFLSALGVYFRDVGQLTGIVTTVLLFLSPIFYPVSALPVGFQFWMKLNPLTFFIEEGRRTLIYGQIPDGFALISAYLLSGTVAWIGFAFFQKTRRGFADVI